MLSRQQALYTTPHNTTPPQSYDHDSMRSDFVSPGWFSENRNPVRQNFDNLALQIPASPLGDMATRKVRSVVDKRKERELSHITQDIGQGTLKIAGTRQVFPQASRYTRYAPGLWISFIYPCSDWKWALTVHSSREHNKVWALCLSAYVFIAGSKQASSQVL